MSRTDESLAVKPFNHACMATCLEAVIHSITVEIVSQLFRPEFINLIYEAVVFLPLGQGQLRAICKIHIDLLHQRLQEKDIGQEISEAALDLLGDSGFDPVYGAQPLKRAIQRQIENPLANELLSGHFMPGDVIKVDTAADGLTFSKH